ncbi:HNH endonuclease [Spirosoma aureum]|uniref:HNH endonuclease n=1 Tax=Spirosoma aureum TaxID=2692134 RepID=A0A6G9AWS3_9BACT|nr:HNH endonuclease signature motif containing protein [Spirosoma aureum]QIP16796.1 HNH endonuclease [Spirosoma aureum]
MKIRFFQPSDNQPSNKSEPAFIRKNQFQTWSESERQFLRDNWETKTTQEIAEALNRPKAGVQTYAWRFLKLKKSPEAKFMAASKGQQSRKDAYTEAEKQYLRDHWQTMTIQQMADALGRKAGSVKSMGQKKMRLKKTHESLSTLSKRLNAGQFKKGSISSNAILDEAMPIRIRHSHKKRGGLAYKWIRVAWKKWIMYHVYLWEQAYGPAPEGMIVVFKNKDTMDCRLDNLELITRQEHAIRNSGSINLPDGYVAHLLAVRNPELQQELLQYPELLELKRNQIHLERTLKQLTAHANSDANNPVPAGSDQADAC